MFDFHFMMVQSNESDRKNDIQPVLGLTIPTVTTMTIQMLATGLTFTTGYNNLWSHDCDLLFPSNFLAKKKINLVNWSHLEYVICLMIM